MKIMFTGVWKENIYAVNHIRCENVWDAMWWCEIKKFTVLGMFPQKRKVLLLLLVHLLEQKEEDGHCVFVLDSWITPPIRHFFRQGGVIPTNFIMTLMLILSGLDLLCYSWHNYIFQIKWIVSNIWLLDEVLQLFI